MEATKRGSCCNRRCCSIWTEIILTLVGIGLVIQIFFVPNAVEKIFKEGLEDNFIITSKNRDKNDSVWKNWVSNDHKNSPNQYFTFYLYNITNPADVLDGAYPNLTELGPFVFKRKQYRKNIIFMENDTIVSYRYEYDYEFLPEKSVENASLDDPIIVFNPAILTMINSINTYLNTIDSAFDQFLETKDGYRVFYQKTIYDILWNTSDYEVENTFGTDTFFSAISFAANNVEEYTGKGNKNDLRKLRKYFNYTAMTFWTCYNDTEIWNETAGDDVHEDSCYCEEQDPDTFLPDCFFYEAVEGSRESVQFPYNNWVTKNKKLVLWETEKYRKAIYEYDKTVTKHGIKMYRFKVSDETFENATNYGYNTHYNQFGYDGVVNLTSRKIHISIFQQTVAFVSKGHFLDGDYYIDTVSNIMGVPEPDPVEDDQWFDIEPRSGAIFHRHLAYQVNLGVAPLRVYERASNFTNLTNMVVPYYCLQVDAEATNKQYDEYSSQLILVDTIIDVSIYGGASFALVCFVLAFWLICRRKRGQNQQVTLSYKKVMKSNTPLATQQTGGLMATPSMGQANALPTATPDRPGHNNNNNNGGAGYGSTSNLRELDENGAGDGSGSETRNKDGYKHV